MQKSVPRLKNVRNSILAAEYALLSIFLVPVAKSAAALTSKYPMRMPTYEKNFPEMSIVEMKSGAYNEYRVARRHAGSIMTRKIMFLSLPSFTLYSRSSASFHLNRQLSIDGRTFTIFFKVKRIARMQMTATTSVTTLSPSWLSSCEESTGDCSIIRAPPENAWLTGTGP